MDTRHVTTHQVKARIDCEEACESRPNERAALSVQRGEARKEESDRNKDNRRHPLWRFDAKSPEHERQHRKLKKEHQTPGREEDLCSRRMSRDNWEILEGGARDSM